MSKTKITISINEVTMSYITIKLSLPIQALNKSNISFLLNQSYYSDYDLEELQFGEIYRITPKIPFTPYSQITISIDDIDYCSNMLTLFYSKKYLEDTSDYYVTLPNNLSSGVYKINLLYLNDISFTLESPNIVISQGINPSYCNIIPNKVTPYAINEEIILTLTLNDIFNSHIPDGLYEIQLDTKKL